jgi:hypothetical protein
MKNKKIIIPAVIVGALVLGTVAYSANALAANDNPGRNTERSGALAEKLGIDQSKVEAAMEEIRTERHEERKAEVSSKLDKAVSDGAITAEQKQKILDKQAEIQGQMGQKRTEMKQWYEDNGIDFDKVHQYIGFGGNRQGNGEGRGMGSRNGAN